MTSSPFSNLYFSNFSCGTSSAAGLAAAALAEAGFAGTCEGVFAVARGAGFAGDCVCASANLAKGNIISPSVKTLRKKCLITASFQMGTIWRSANGQHSQVSNSPLVAYPASVQA